MAAPITHFEDRNKNIRKAREIAYRSFVKNSRLRSPSIGGDHFEPRSLAETLRQEVIMPDIDENMEQAMEASHSMESENVREYDADRERRETEEMDKENYHAEDAQKLKDIYNALMTLADTNTPKLDEEMVNREIIPILRDAPRIIVQYLQKQTSEHEREARINYMQNSEEIARAINAKNYPNLDNPQSAEFTREDHKHTMDTLRYVYERAGMLDLAAGNWLGIVSQINKELAGLDTGRSR